MTHPTPSPTTSDLPPTGVSLDAWRELLKAQDTLARLRPWQWLEDTHIFGVEDPTTGEVNYVSVQGAHGEDPAVLLYPGEEGWTAYWALMEFAAEAGLVPDDLALTVPMIVAGWAEEDALTPADRGLLDALAYHEPTPWGWPLFRSFRPGWAPWYPTPDEVRALTLALAHIPHVVDLVREKGADFLLRELEQGRVLVRVPRAGTEGRLWQDAWRPFPEEREEPYRIRIPADLLDQLRQRMPNREELQVDLFMLPTGVQERPDERPYIPYVLLLVDAEGGDVIAADMLSAREGIRALFEGLPGQIVRHLAKAEIRPARLRVRSRRLHNVLDPLAQELALELLTSAKLPALDRVRVYLLERVVDAGTNALDGTTFPVVR